MRRHRFLIPALIVLTLASKAFPEDEAVKTKEYTARTSDGWELSITRFVVGDEPAPAKSRSTDNKRASFLTKALDFTKGLDFIKDSKDRSAVTSPSRKKAVVILCHGFNLNNKFWDLDRRCSFARFLAKNGYDVWTPSLRGSGQSTKPILSSVRSIVKLEFMNIPRQVLRLPRDITKFDWNIDDHIYKDIPAIIDLVKEETGFEKVYWIGHSMGGIIMYAFLETERQYDIAGFIPMCSMMVIPQPLSPHLEIIASQKPLMNASLLINTTMASQLRNFTLGTIKHPIEDLLIKRENMYDEVIFRLFRIAVDDTSPGVVSQFSDSIKAGEIMSNGGGYSYADNLRLIRVPILIAGAGADRFVAEEQLIATLEAVSSRDKNMAVFSTQYGYSADYGHCDLIVGKNSEKEVYPVILNWLEERYAVE